MFVFIVRRILQTIPVLLGVSLVVFLIMQMVPGDPATLLAGEGATKETIEIDSTSAWLGSSNPLSVL